MKITENLMLLSLLAVLVTSCGKSTDDAYDPDMAIRFMPAIHSLTNQTRSIFPEQSSFKVWSFALDKGQWSDDKSQAKEWIVADEVKFSNGAWRNTQESLWNARTGSLTFFACAPSTLPMNYDALKGLYISDFDVLKDDTDILFTDPIADVNKLECGGEVDIPFQHALCQIAMSIQSIDAGEAELHIKSVTMDNVGYKGDFCSTQSGWTLTKDRTCLEFCTEEFVLEPEVKTLGKFLCIPQSGSRPVTVTYDLYLRGEKFLKDQQITALPVSTTWEPGRQYQYALEMSLDKLIYKTDVLDY